MNFSKEYKYTVKMCIRDRLITVGSWERISASEVLSGLWNFNEEVIIRFMECFHLVARPR